MSVAPASIQEQHRHDDGDLGQVPGDEIVDHVADVPDELASLLDGMDDRAEVVVGDHHVGGFPCDVAARPAHRDTDICLPQCGSVVHTVTGHRDDISPPWSARTIASLSSGFTRANTLTSPGSAWPS